MVVRSKSARPGGLENAPEIQPLPISERSFEVASQAAYERSYSRPTTIAKPISDPVSQPGGLSLSGTDDPVG
jgi:hypothetical protein